MISTYELMERTGATERQINYWCGEVISPVGKSNPGSGVKRRFEEAVVYPVAFLVRVSKAFGTPLCRKDLKKFYDAYDEGFIYLDESIMLRWDTFYE